MSGGDPTADLPGQRNVADFVAVAVRTGFLAAETAADLAAEAVTTGGDPVQLAARRGVIDAAQADILDTLRRPCEAIPGYEILDVLGRGGMGVVFRARQIALDRVVALKTILVGLLGNETTVQRFEREARAVAKLAHPHIVAAFDCGRASGRVWYAMEFVQGEDVSRRLRGRGVFDEWTTWGIVRQAAAGLAHAAAQGLVHRDIKPANLLLLEPPAGFPLPAGMPLVKIADFGLARGTEPEAEQLTATNMTVGTPQFMAPEQLQGGQVGPQADIYALGATAHCMLAGRPPHDGLTLPQLVVAHLKGATPRVRELRPVSAATDELVAAMMESDPARRVRDYADLFARIDALRLTSSADVGTAELPLPAAADAPTGAFEPVSPMTAGVAVTTALPPPPPAPAGRFRLGTTPQLAALAVLAAAVVAWSFVGGRTAPSRDMIRSGQVAALFDGQDMAAWTTRKGGWAPAVDEEGATMLEGRGLIARRLAAPGGAPGPAHYAISCVVDLHEAGAVEMRFDLAAGGTTPCLAVRLDASGVSVGERRDESGLRTRFGPLPLAGGSDGLHELAVERHTRGWWVVVDGTPVTSLVSLHASPAAEVQFQVDGGAARLSDVMLEELIHGQAPGAAE